MVLPVHHILRGINAPLLHPEEVGMILVMTRVYIHRTVMHHWCGVTGKPRLHERILCQTEGRAKREEPREKKSFHYIKGLVITEIPL